MNLYLGGIIQLAIGGNKHIARLTKGSCELIYKIGFINEEELASIKYIEEWVLLHTSIKERSKRGIKIENFRDYLLVLLMFLFIPTVLISIGI